MNPKTSEQNAEGGARAERADGSLGEQLRRAREARGVTLREVSEQTRITMRHLEAIEADNYKDLPGGIFNKSFVKSYARYVRFDEARAVELYERQARAAGLHTDEVATTPQRARVYTGEATRSPLMTYGLSILIVGVLALIVYAGLNYYRRTSGAQTAGPAATATPAANANAQTAAATPTPAPTVEGFRVQVKATRMFWLTSWQDDDKKKRGRMLKPDAPEEFEPASALNLRYDQVSADALQVSVNGQALKTPTDTTTWTITKDNFRQFAQ
ncbi:MAG TPA: helix-turn-helix domain-containing protein [Pyrinomonadaceae bacterium]|nr:helix-turn-helix domain-containing protein [Pyrinomonadaceae bacterium]